MSPFNPKTILILFPYLLLEQLAVSQTPKVLLYAPTIAPSTETTSFLPPNEDRSLHNHRSTNARVEKYESAGEMTADENYSSSNTDSQQWSWFPRKQYNHYSSRFEPLAAAASTQYTNIYRNRNLFSKPNWISDKRQNGDANESRASGSIYYSPERTYGSRSVNKPAVTPTTTTFIQTTSETRTAPATDVASITARSSSTQEMQRDQTQYDNENIFHEKPSGTRRSITNRLNNRDSYRDPDYPNNRHGKDTNQDRKTYFPDEDSLVFPSPTVFRPREYKRPTEDDVHTVQPLEASEFEALKEIIEAKKKTEVDDRSTLNLAMKIIPPVCKDPNGYCQDSQDYPKDILNSILSHSLKPDVFQKIFGDSLDNSSISESQADLLSRIDLPQEVPLCAAIEHTIYPKVAKNKEGKYMYVVNHDEYIQGVKVEKCAGEASSCQFSDGSPTGYQTFCRQKFIYKKLLAFNQGKTLTDTFRLPSCCVCYIKSSFADRHNFYPSSRSTSTTPSTIVGSKNGDSNINSNSVPTEPSEFAAERTDSIDNTTVIFSHQDTHSDNPSSIALFNATSTSAPEDSAAKSGSARSF